MRKMNSLEIEISMVFIWRYTDVIKCYNSLHLLFLNMTIDFQADQIRMEILWILRSSIRTKNWLHYSKALWLARLLQNHYTDIHRIPFHWIFKILLRKINIKKMPIHLILYHIFQCLTKEASIKNIDFYQWTNG